MIRINENGVTREMTADEIEAFKSQECPDDVPKDTQLDEIEAALMELAALVGGDGNNG